MSAVADLCRLLDDRSEPLHSGLALVVVPSDDAPIAGEDDEVFDPKLGAHSDGFFQLLWAGKGETEGDVSLRLCVRAVGFDQSSVGAGEFTFQQSSIARQDRNGRTRGQPQNLAKFVELFLGKFDDRRCWIRDASDKTAGKTP